MLKSIELVGFKSFGKKARMDFDAPVTAIVGPNGSGKSNAAEAFRFALGEQSMKSLRGRRGEDFLFNGSSQAPRANRASVKVVLDNKNRLLDIDFPEVVIERVVHRDGSNEYFINSSPVRLKDITSLLSGANIGSTGHHIISQGEADRILMVNPKERREMLEDALGLKIYHLEKKEAFQKLLKTKDNLEDIKALRQELSPRFSHLKSQMDKIEAGKVLEESLKEDYRTYFSIEAGLISLERDQHGSKEINLKKRLEELDAYIESNEHALEHQEVSNEIITKLEVELRQISSALQAKEVELGRAEGEFSAHSRLQEKGQPKEISWGQVSKLFSSVRISIKKILSGEIKAAHDIEVLLSDFEEAHSDKEEANYETRNTHLEELDEKIKGLHSEKKELEKHQKAVRDELEKLQGDLRFKRLEADKSKSEYIEAVKERERTAAELQEVLRLNHYLEERLTRFKQEQTEAALLLGREVLNFTKIEAHNDSVLQINIDDLRTKLIRGRVRLEEMGVGDKRAVEREFNEVNERMEMLSGEIDDLVSSQVSLHKLIEELDEKLHSEFVRGIEEINKAFQTFFEKMFGGGKAYLAFETRKLDEGESENDRGVVIEIELPRKRVRGLHMLSGGERALTSIALLFAMSSVNPPPFIILDETDAALDEANSRRYGDMIEELAERSQLILITHNRETMSRAGILYGITMGLDSVSKLLSIKFEEAVSIAKK